MSPAADSEGLALAWDIFSADWSDWSSDLKRARTRENLFPGRNILADEKLGRFVVECDDGETRICELATGTFPDLITRRGRVRFIGISWSDASQPNRMRSGGVALSFGELARLLAAGRDLSQEEGGT